MVGIVAGECDSDLPNTLQNRDDSDVIVLQHSRKAAAARVRHHPVVHIEPVPASPHRRAPRPVGTERNCVDVTTEDGGLRLVVRGRLDAEAGAVLRALSASAAEVEAEIVAIDITRVSSFTDAGVAAFVASVAATGSERTKVRFSARAGAPVDLLLAVSASRVG